ncbi:hypothetical protein Pflav_008540 [Phytohabitans flavus]|uniref:Uncharacterized protein n=1 Tax=Phytohabitans flavus TaxID=1076124 RepID=A0A6F8XKU7_9ACTN|nr:hypothetical protein [Phytohabitans flavus]BCB74444.1 hypothetical protein Pflav_008540 [Phytohabitans flavus]
MVDGDDGAGDEPDAVDVPALQQSNAGALRHEGVAGIQDEFTQDGGDVVAVRPWGELLRGLGSGRPIR